MDKYEQKRIDKAIDHKDERIAWANAKNNAVAIVTASLPAARLEVEAMIAYWANWIYDLEPTSKKVTQERKATEKQVNFIQKLKFEKGEKYNEIETKNLTPFQAKLEIDRLLKLTTVDSGDFSADIEGTKEDDYNPDTGELL